MEIVIRAAAVYTILWILLRAMGERELSEITAFELVILVVLGEADPDAEGEPHS